MQATITYLLTEQAQRAQMVATGQPVARKQTAVIEIGTDDLQYYPVEHDGSISVDLSERRYILGHEVETGPFSDVPSIPDLVRAGIAREDAAKAKKAADLERGLAGQLAAVEKFLADPSLRAAITTSTSTDYVYAAGVRVDRDTTEYHLACPRWPELVAEAQRRNANDGALSDRESAQKKEKEKALAAEKTAFITAWIAEHESADVAQQHSDGMLCRSDALQLIADSVLDPIAREYEPTVCNLSDCPCGRKDVSCIPPALYPAWKALQAKLPEGSTWELESVRECLRDEEGYVDDEDGDGAGDKRYAVLLHVHCGPFVFDRLVRI